MKLLLDTHVAVWAVNRPSNLPRKIRDLIADERNTIHVSTVSIWEIAIKHSLGRLSAPEINAAQAVVHFDEAGYIVLPVKAEHALAIASLPSRHGDPFDRMLVAQSLTEPMRLVTHDNELGAYSDTVITW